MRSFNIFIVILIAFFNVYRFLCNSPTRPTFQLLTRSHINQFLPRTRNDKVVIVIVINYVNFFSRWGFNRFIIMLLSLSFCLKFLCLLFIFWLLFVSSKILASFPSARTFWACMSLHLSQKIK
ncbi:hypothetical protein ACJW30_12G140100 [Castanea mollissima]